MLDELERNGVVLGLQVVLQQLHGVTQVRDLVAEIGGVDGDLEVGVLQGGAAVRDFEEDHFGPLVSGGIGSGGGGEEGGDEGTDGGGELHLQHRRRRCCKVENPCKTDEFWKIFQLFKCFKVLKIVQPPFCAQKKLSQHFPAI